MVFFRSMQRASRLSKASMLFLSASLCLCMTARLQAAPSFSTAASASQTKFNRTFNSGVKVIPHDSKVHKGGEDAFLQSEDLVGVADGVGGWAEHGVDPGIYSRLLCTNVKNIHERNNRNDKFEAEYKKSLRDIIIEAADVTQVQGSSTLVLALLDPKENVLHTANFGDSGYILLRREGDEIKTVFRSKEMQKSFNFPYQLGYKRNGDDPSVSQVNKHDIQHGDVIILGTDGCFDNLYDKDILEIVAPIMKTQSELSNPGEVADAIAQRAYQFSHTSGRQSPFGEHSKGLYYGGKEDDITVLVAEIKINSSALPKPDDL